MRLLVILSVLAQAETEAPDGHVVDWVEKPLDDVQLLAALEHAVAGRDEPFKLLVVEDDEDLAGVLTASFDRHGIQTFHAADGAQAILISQRELPDLLVLDLACPTSTDSRSSNGCAATSSCTRCRWSSTPRATSTTATAGACGWDRRRSL